MRVRLFGGGDIFQTMSIVFRNTWNAPITPATEKPTNVTVAKNEVEGVLLL
jgi:hypothetical protein